MGIVGHKYLALVKILRETRWWPPAQRWHSIQSTWRSDCPINASKMNGASPRSCSQKDGYDYVHDYGDGQITVSAGSAARGGWIRAVRRWAHRRPSGWDCFWPVATASADIGTVPRRDWKCSSFPQSNHLCVKVTETHEFNLIAFMSRQTRIQKTLKYNTK